MSSIPKNNFPTLDELEILVKSLSETSPPPNSLVGANHLVPSSGIWVLVGLGAGGYAVRAQYENSLTGERETYATDDEMKGSRVALLSALKFCVKMATCHRQDWHRV